MDRVGTFGQLVKTMRLKAGLSQDSLGRRVAELGGPRLSQWSISYYESGRQLPKIGNVYFLARALGIPVNQAVQSFKGALTDRFLSALPREGCDE